jgi:hypothetical protein
MEFRSGQLPAPHNLTCDIVTLRKRSLESMLCMRSSIIFLNNIARLIFEAFFCEGNELSWEVMRFDREWAWGGNRLRVSKSVNCELQKQRTSS